MSPYSSFEEIKSELSKVIVGQEDGLKLFLCLLSKGHGLLMESRVGKPYLSIHWHKQVRYPWANSIYSRSYALGCDGTEILQSNKDRGNREFVFIKGPIFANVILADEINRLSKTQSALLEAMQEKM